MHPLLGQLTWNFGIFRKLGTCLEPLHRNLYLEPLHSLELLLGTSANLPKPSWNLGTSWNLNLEPWDLSEPSLGTLILEPPFFKLCHLPKTCLYLNPFLELLYFEPRSEPLGTWEPFGTWEPLGTFTWNPCLEPRNLPEPSLKTLSRLESSLKTLLGTLEPPGFFTWNL